MNPAAVPTPAPSPDRPPAPFRDRTPAAGGPSCHSDPAAAVPLAPELPVVALAGSPNVGKSTLFNALTGAGRDVGNWPGTTVEVGRGRWDAGAAGSLALVDLPGAYSLQPLSPDEALTRDLLLGQEARCPDLVVVLLDAAHLTRSLVLLEQVRELDLRVVAAVTMADVARRRGAHVDTAALERATGVPVVLVDPRRRRDLPALAEAVAAALRGPVPAAVAPVVGAGAGGADAELALADARFGWIADVAAASLHRDEPVRTTWSDRIDRVAVAPVLGPVVFLAVMWLVFQVTTTVAAPLQDALDAFFTGPVSAAAVAVLDAVGLGDTWVRGLVVDGLIAGVGMLLTFVPLMAIMFALLALLEDSGYMARAAVVTDRLMRVVGLPGRAFLPLVVGFGCNVPAVSAARVLPHARQRLLTTLLVPFTSCSARLTVYVLVASVFFGQRAGTVVFAMYVTSIVLVVLVGLLLRSTLIRAVGDDPLVIDLPPYQVPAPALLGALTWARLRGFLRTASGIIVATVAAVWFLGALPAPGQPGSFGDVPVQDSVYAAAAGAVAPVFTPAGFADWHATGALLVGFVAKEAVVSSWAQTYATQEPEDAASPGALGDALRADFARTSGGHPNAAALAFLVFLLAYTPCVATLAAQKREIGLRWTLTGVAIQLAVAWVLAVAVFQVGRLVS